MEKKYRNLLVACLTFHFREVDTWVIEGEARKLASSFEGGGRDPNRNR